jgi:hypothetical protein
LRNTGRRRRNHPHCRRRHQVPGKEREELISLLVCRDMKRALRHRFGTPRLTFIYRCGFNRSDDRRGARQESQA